jgi:hypothetical protein
VPPPTTLSSSSRGRFFSDDALGLKKEAMDMRCGAEAIAFLSPGAMARDKREGYSAQCRSHENANVFHSEKRIHLRCWKGSTFTDRSSSDSYRTTCLMPGTYLASAQTHVDHAGPGGGTLCTEQHYRRDITFAQGSATGGACTWHMGLGTCTTRAR